MKAGILVIIALLYGPFSWAMNTKWYVGSTGEKIELEKIVDEVEPGSVVFVGEIHNQALHHKNQLRLLKILAEKYPGVKISVAMEFFYYPNQEKVDRYLDGELNETDFLQQIGWQNLNSSFFNMSFSPSESILNFPFEWYRDIVKFPKTTGGRTYAINAPPALTSSIAKNGLENTPDSLLKWLPTDFSMGRDIYFQRFQEDMEQMHPLPAPVLKHYFEAQSVWDDTMAWRISNIMKQEPGQILVVIVGDFHVAFFGGLPFQLQRRNFKKFFNLSQMIDQGELNQAPWLPDLRWGVRSDFVGVSSETE